MSDENQPWASAESLLRALLRVALEEQRARNEELTIGYQILLLQDSGLTQGQASRILGISPNQAPSYLRNVTNKRLLEKLAKKKGSATEGAT